MCFCYRERSYLVLPSTASWEWSPVVVTISRHGGTTQWRYVCWVLSYHDYFTPLSSLYSVLIPLQILSSFFKLFNILYTSLSIPLLPYPSPVLSLPLTLFPSPFLLFLFFFLVLCYMFTHSLVHLFQAWNVNWETRHMMIQFEEENVVFSCLTADCKVSHDSIIFLAHSETHVNVITMMLGIWMVMVVK